MKKRIWIIVQIIILILPLAAEEKRHDSDKKNEPSIESVEITPNPVGQGDIFTMTVVVDHENSADVEFPLEDLPEQLQLWRGPYVRSFIETDKNDASVRKVRITATFKAKTSGRMIIPQLEVAVENRILKTEPQLLRVGLYKSRKLYIPLEAEWRQGFEDLYVGEAIPVYLTVKNQEAVTLFDQVRVAYPSEGLFEEVAGIGEISAVSEGDIVLFDIPAASFIYTATKSGEIKIPSAGVDYEGITGWTDNLFLNIKRLPDDLDTGAVGSFSFYSDADDSRADTDGEIVLVCRVEGEGNFNYFEIPEPEVSGCILISTEEINNFKVSPAGYTGSRSVKRTYSAEGPGTVDILVPEFDYFDKKNGIIITEARKKYSFKIEGEAPAEEAGASSGFYFEKKPASAENMFFKSNHYKNVFMYVLLLPGFLFFVVSMLFKWKKLLPGIVLTLIIMVAIVSVGRIFLSVPAAATYPPEVLPSALYNGAIDAYEAGELTQSLHLIRSAVYADPVNNSYRVMLDWLEEENGYINSVSPSIRLHPDIFFYTLVFSVNLLFTAIVLRKRGVGGLSSVFLILSGLIIILSSFMILYTDISRSRVSGVCLEGSSLKKIPRESAALWMPVKEGSAVKVLDRAEGFLLIETGLGVKGWIDESSVLEDRRGNG